MKKLFCLALLMFYGLAAYSQTEEEEKASIAKTIQYYFEGMMDRDKSKLDQAFDPSARLIGYRGDNFTVTPYEEWAGGTAKGEKRNPTDFQNHLVGIEIKGYTAIAKTELFWPGIYYYDFLTLVKVDGIWKIVHKTWYEEKR
jgi:hypothetical protein